MTLQTLPFCPQPNYATESEPRRKVNQFGDGYQQRIADGLNPLQRKFSLTFKLKLEQAVTLDQFFANHGGVKAFHFRDKASGKLVKVVCPKWSKKTGRTHIEFSCEFEEVI
ncbi:phage tail protein [Frederiksenia canicola]|uniref:Phage tail protein n=1 Tax=Frederiksenia canicola TaxID=123824 RepID=A0AAE6X7F4_9PAST|nr:phage tail protein [Frederiksenia canicola]QIM65274.1 phage tail protein [Frederiksenia canicola]RPE96296.1 phage-related protein [Frederiksenia canicola]